MLTISEPSDQIFKALHQFQGAVRAVQKDSKNPHFKSRYVSLEAVIDATRDPLQQAGLSFFQAPGDIVDNKVAVTTVVTHTSGQWLRSTMQMPIIKFDPQAVGTAITYSCRYSLMALLGIAPTEDDDAETAVGRGPEKAPSSAAKPASVPTSTEATQQDIDAWAQKIRDVIEKATGVTRVIDIMNDSWTKTVLAKMPRELKDELTECGKEKIAKLGKAKKPKGDDAEAA